MPLGKRLRWIRESKGLGQAEVRALLEAQGVHVANSTYSGWETGKTYPTIPQLIALSKVLEVSSDVLLCLQPLVLE